MRRVLNTGSGPATNDRLHKAFSPDQWKEVRLDIDPRVEPDIVGTVQDMTAIIGDATFDAIWSSHNVEHLHTHEVLPTFKEFRRILKPDGFAFITCPDLGAICRLVVERGLTTEAYMSLSGPITPSDMLFGHARSIALGNTFMCHNTGFDDKTLGETALAAGFSEVRVAPGTSFDLWALLTMPQTDIAALKGWLAGTREAFLV